MSSAAAADSRGGFALPAAIMALVLLSALVAGALFVSTEELRSGRSDTIEQRALAAAEAALDSAVLAWDRRRNTSDSVGARRTSATVAAAPNATVSVSIVRVDRRAVLVSATASAGGDGRAIPARHTVASSLRLVGPRVRVRAALITRGPVVIDGGSIDGGDSATVPDVTRVCPAGEPGAGIIVPDVASVVCAGCATDYSPSVTGSPAIDASGVVDASMPDLGDETRATLTSRATIDLAAGTFTPASSMTAGDCDRADRLNWGDPSGRTLCSEWYPIVHVRGDAVIAAGGVGQGILLVDGSLRVEGGARFVGIVVAGGAVIVDGVGAGIDGIVYALGTDASSASRVVNGAAIRYVSCAVQRAALGAARLVRTKGRSWVELR
jgi:hypothetical protein